MKGHSARFYYGCPIVHTNMLQSQLLMDFDKLLIAICVPCHVQPTNCEGVTKHPSVKSQENDVFIFLNNYSWLWTRPGFLCCGWGNWNLSGSIFCSKEYQPKIGVYKNCCKLDWKPFNPNVCWVCQGISELWLLPGMQVCLFQSHSTHFSLEPRGQVRSGFACYGCSPSIKPLFKLVFWQKGVRDVFVTRNKHISCLWWEGRRAIV